MHLNKKELNRKNLTDLYANKTTYDIAKIFNVSRSTVSNWLKKYDVKINNAQAKYETNKEIRLTQKQKDFLLGTMLGDGHISVTKSNRLARFSVSHGSKQLEYIKWKAQVLGNLECGVKKHTVFNKKVQRKYQTYSFCTKATEDLLGLQKLYYNNKIKVIRPELLQQIRSPFSISVWVMDDGTFNRASKRINICSDSFTYKEHTLLKKMLFDNFGLNARIVKYGSHNRLHFTVRETRKLANIVSPYIIESMHYKIQI